MSSNLQKKMKIKVIKTQESMKSVNYTEEYKNFIYFSLDLSAGFNKDGKMKKICKFPKDWQNLDTSILNKKYNAVAILTGKKSGITVIDYDSKDLFERDKILYPEIINYYIKNNKGYHCYFKYNEKIPSTGVKGIDDDGGIDFQNDGKCVFAPPSTYQDENKKTYKYEIMQNNQILDMSIEYYNYLINTYLSIDKKEMTKKVTKDVPEEKKEYQNNIPKISLEEVDILTKIKKMCLKMKCFDSYSDWMQLCFIIYNETNGSPEGKNVFLDICKEVCKDFNEEECNKKWYSVKTTKEKKLTIATLCQKYIKMFPEEKNLEKKLDCINENPEYIIEKEKFESRIFKLDSPFFYVKTNEDNSLEFLDETKLKQWAKGNFKKMLDIKQEKEINFTDLWIDDMSKRQYNRIVFDPNPNNNNSKNYNCFKGFNYDDTIEPVAECDSNFLQLLKRICIEDNIYEYFKQWIAHIIQFPYKKTNVAIVLYSSTKGVGKNCIVDGINKLLHGYTAKVKCIEDLTKTFNSHLCNKLFIHGDEISAKAKKVSDKLKEAITQTQQNLERKGKDVVEVTDHSNWLFMTNNYDAFKVETGDRRLEMIHCIEERLSTTDSIAFYKYLDDPIQINKLYNYFKHVDITYKIGIESPPMTKYKTELEYGNRAGYIQMLYKEPSQFVNNIFTSTDMLVLVNEYSKHNYLPQTSDLISFSKFISKIFAEYKKRGNTSNNYNFKNVNKSKFNEILYNYDKEYWKYINHYDDIEEPNFNIIEVNEIDCKFECL